MPGGFADITIVIVVAAILGIIARALRQPTIVAYIFTGMLVAGVGLVNMDSRDILDVMSTFGITLLLFLVGLEMRFDNLKAVSKAAVVTGLGQILFTSGIGYLIVRLLGFDALPAFYIAAALTFSSTIIVVKLLSQKRDLQSLYGRIVVGFLIIQDIVAIFLLMFLAGFEPGSASADLISFIITFFKGIVLLALTVWLSKKVFPWMFDKLARSPELIFITSIAWAFGISLLVASDFVGLSVEIGGFMAGIALARSLEQFQIESQLRPLRDFFIVIFFVVLGSSLVIGDVQAILWPAIILSLFVLIGNPLIVLTIMGLLGFRKKTSFYSSVTVAQISEFSLILMAMGLTLGHVTNSQVSLVTFVGIITIIISTYFIQHNSKIFYKISGFLSIFEKKNAKEEIPLTPVAKGPIILAGARRLGMHLLKTIEKQKLVIVEFDPVVVKQLQKENYKVVFGDITEKDIQEHVHFDQAYIIISTIPNLDDNHLLVEKVQEIKKLNGRAPQIIVTAYTGWEAKKLYEAGADYVVLPHFLGGKHLASLIQHGRIDMTTMENWRKHDQKILTTL
ncbi:cation:proton antiporter [Patescibacteria group bacterium]